MAGAHIMKLHFPTEVRFVHAQNGFPGSPDLAEKYSLVIGQVYCVRKVEVHQSSTMLWLADHPGRPDGAGFGAEHFEPVMDEDDEQEKPRLEEDRAPLTQAERSAVRAAIAEMNRQAEVLWVFLSKDSSRGAVAGDLNRLMHQIRGARSTLERKWEEERQA
jgi:hypothetical protein